MNNDKNMLDENEVMAMMIAYMVGVGILSLPAGLVKDAKQDGWISAAIGAVYPFYIGFAAVYMCKYNPKDNILVLSKRYLGKILGTILNSLFLVFIYIYIILTATGFTNIFRVYGTPFLTPFKIQIVLIIIIIYASNKGIKLMGKTSEVSFYTISILMTLLVFSLLKGQIINVKPFFGAGFTNILKASIESAYAYGGIEQIFLIYPLMKNKNRLKNAVVKGVGITAIFYAWATFISIYFLGYKVTGKNIWPVFLVSESVSVSIINSFKSIFLLSWTGIMCNDLANQYNSILDILTDILKIKNRNWLHILVVPLITYGFTKLPNPMYRSSFAGKVVPIITIFSLLYATTICIMIFFDKNKKVVKN